MVNIEVISAAALAADDVGRWVGTGWVIDAGRGLLVTNRHVSGSSPA